MKRGVLGVIAVIACLIAVVWLMSPRAVTETITRSGAGDGPDEGALSGEVLETPIVPSHRPYEPLP